LFFARQAERECRVDEFADAFEESELFVENSKVMGRPGAESRTSINTIQELAVQQGTVTPAWWGLWILIKVSTPPRCELPVVLLQMLRRDKSSWTPERQRQTLSAGDFGPVKNTASCMMTVIGVHGT
jgi:hypothetical protein